MPQVMSPLQPLYLPILPISAVWWGIVLDGSISNSYATVRRLCCQMTPLTVADWWGLWIAIVAVVSATAMPQAMSLLGVGVAVLVGEAFNCSISNSYATGDVSADGGGGGLVGLMLRDSMYQQQLCHR